MRSMGRWTRPTLCVRCVELKYKLNTSEMQPICETTFLDATRSWGEKRPVPGGSQRTIEQAVAQQPPNSDNSANRITKSIAKCIAMDLSPYSVVENVGFWEMVHTHRGAEVRDTLSAIIAPTLQSLHSMLKTNQKFWIL